MRVRQFSRAPADSTSRMCAFQAILRRTLERMCESRFSGAMFLSCAAFGDFDVLCYLCVTLTSAPSCFMTSVRFNCSQDSCRCYDKQDVFIPSAYLGAEALGRSANTGVRTSRLRNGAKAGKWRVAV